MDQHEWELTYECKNEKGMTLRFVYGEGQCELADVKSFQHPIGEAVLKAIADRMAENP